MPQVLLRVRRAVRRLKRRSTVVEPSGAENEASWRAMLQQLDQADRETERRLAALERALNG